MLLYFSYHGAVQLLENPGWSRRAWLGRGGGICGLESPEIVLILRKETKSEPKTNICTSMSSEDEGGGGGGGGRGMGWRGKGGPGGVEIGGNREGGG